MAVPPLFIVVRFNPEGTSSSKTILVAVFGPALVTVNSKVTVSPTFGVALDTPEISLTRLRSADCSANASLSSSSSLWSPSSLLGVLSESGRSEAVISPVVS